MNKDTIFSILRSILAIAGALIMGKVISGTTIDNVTWETFVGGAIGVISVGWSFFDKTSTLEGFQGALRQLLTFVGFFLVANGIIKADVFALILAGIIGISPIIYAELSKRKSIKIAKGQLGIADLSGVKKVIPLSEIKTVLKTPPAA